METAHTTHDESFPPNRRHHVGDPRTHFQNPWPSFKEQGLLSILKTRFRDDRNFVPVPDTREELVQVRRPDWGEHADPSKSKMKATWIGHASWLVEFPSSPNTISKDSPPMTSDSPPRGVRILFDPVFSERTSPFSFLGPKRFTPTPCTIEELPEVDVVAISHNHYDHLDIDTIKTLQARFPRIHFVCPLGIKDWFIGIGVDTSRITQMDWWEGYDVAVKGKGVVRVVCTPAQHISARGINDKNQTLWSSWAVGLPPKDPALTEDDAGITLRNFDAPQSFEEAEQNPVFGSPRLYFTGDTGYRSVDKKEPTPEEAAAYPHCPAFTSIGRLLGPFDLGLVPIGCYSPRDHMSAVHCAPEDAVLLAKDVRAKYAVGMHYGTVRGGLSANFEDVREPPRRFKESCEREGLKWDVDAGLCDVGETVCIS